MTKPPLLEVPERKIATLQTLSESLIAGIRSVPSHKEFAPKAIEARRSASTFLDENFYKLEQERVFRKSPLAVTLSVMLPEPGSVLTHDGYGIPLLLMRGKDGQVRAFLNACQHRGAKVVEQCGPHKASRVTCPYHAWTYALDGRLIGVPREEAFKNLDKAGRHLAALPCKEAGGFIWVILDRNAEPDFGEIVPELVSDLDSLGFRTIHVYGQKTFELKANWKLVLEPFFEPYHVQRLHAKSLQGLFADVPCVSQFIGPHLIQISGKAKFTPDMVDTPGENIHKLITLGIHLFPCTVIITSPYYISVLFIMPTAIDKSTVHYFMLTPTPPDTEKAAEVYSRSYEMIVNVFGNEDFRAAESAQVGIASGALKELVYCGLEEHIPAYYERLDRHLGE